MKAHVSQTAFIAGQVDEQTQARTETQLYRNGAARLLNCLLLATGGVKSRWGTADCGPAPAGAVRMEEFSFSLEQSYQAVFSNGRCDFYFASDGVAAGSVTGAPWTSAMIPRLRFAQAGDVMWVTHPDMEPQLIRRTGVSSWTLGPMTYDPGGRPTFRYEPTAVTCTHNPAGTLTFSAGFLTAAYVGTALLVYDVANKLYRSATIATVPSATVCTVTWLDTAPAAPQTTRLWEEQAFSTTRGWPRTVCIYQQRLIFGGSRDQGDAVWMSGAGRYFYFGRLSVDDADPIALSLGTTRVREIQHTIAGPQLTFFTESAALYLPEGDSRPLTPGNLPKVRVIGPYGTGNVRPASFDGGVLMVQGNGNAVRDLAYSNETENLVADPVSLPATGFLGTIVDSAFMAASQERPEQYAFFVTADGRIVKFHSIREQRVSGWAEWTTDGSFVAIGVAGTSLFAVVDRGASGRRIERFDPGRAFDCGLQVDRPYTVPHLANRVLHGRAGDDYYGSGTSNGSGVVTLAREVESAGGLPPSAPAEVGLAFDWWVDPLPPVIELPDGTMAQRVQRLIRIGLRLHRAAAASVNAEALLLFSDGFDPELVPHPYTGWWWASTLGWNRRGEDSQLCPRITRGVPMPLALLAIKREVKV